MNSSKSKGLRDALFLANKIQEGIALRDKVVNIKKNDPLYEDKMWCWREMNRNKNLKTRKEKYQYYFVLLDAVIWGKNVK